MIIRQVVPQQTGDLLFFSNEVICIEGNYPRL